MLANILFAFTAVFSPHSLCGRGSSLRASLPVETRFSRGACAHACCNSYTRLFVNRATRCTQAALYRPMLCVGLGLKLEDYITS